MVNDQVTMSMGACMILPLYVIHLPLYVVNLPLYVLPPTYCETPTTQLNMQNILGQNMLYTDENQDENVNDSTVPDQNVVPQDTPNHCLRYVAETQPVNEPQISTIEVSNHGKQKSADHQNVGEMHKSVSLGQTKTTNEQNSLSICHLNVAGLKNKIENGILDQYLSQYDLILLNENI